MAEDRQRVTVRLNSGDYQGYVNGKVATREGKDFGRRYEIVLTNHPSLEKVTVKRNQFWPIEEPRSGQ
jgi:hypothetical protein